MRVDRVHIGTCSLVLFIIFSICAGNTSAFEFPLPPVQTVPAPEPVEGKDYVAGEVLVKFKTTAKEVQRTEVHSSLGSEKLTEFAFINVDHVKLAKGLTVKEAIELYRKDSSVEYAEPNLIFSFSTAPPYNPLYTQQTNLARIQAENAWSLTIGRADVVVGIIDSGIPYRYEDINHQRTIVFHEDFFYHDAVLNADIFNIWISPTWGNTATPYCDSAMGIDGRRPQQTQPPCTMPTNPPFQDVDDTSGHGSHVAGIIGATPYADASGNTHGIVGLNWQVKLLPCKVSDPPSASEAITCMDYFRWVRDQGVNIIAINASWGKVNDADWTWPGTSLSLYGAIGETKDILFIAAAGNANPGGQVACANKTNPNNDQQPQYPASYSTHHVDTIMVNGQPQSEEVSLLHNVISVAATGPNDEIGAGIWPHCNNVSFESCYGRRSVHIGAPGIDILSTLPVVSGYSGASCLDELPGQEGQYCSLSGTSMAAPHVTGLAALVASKYMNAGQGFNSMTLKNLILTGGNDVAALKPYTITGKRINAADTLNCVNRTAFSVLRVSPAMNSALIAPIRPNETTKIAVLSLNCANSSSPVTVSPLGGTPVTLPEETVMINGNQVGTGIFSGSWNPGQTIPARITFSSPAGSETYSAPTLTSMTYAETMQTFTTVFSDADSAGDIARTGIALSTGGVANSIIVAYDRLTNTLSLWDDTGTAVIGSCAIGSVATISNSQGTVNCNATTVQVSGNTFTIAWSITPRGSFAGTKNIYTYAEDFLGLTTGVLQRGPWIIWASVPGQTPSTPALSWNPAPESNKMQAVVRGSNGTSLYSGTFNSSGVFEGWTIIPNGSSDSAPALAWNPNASSTQLVVRQANNSIWTASFNASGVFNGVWTQVSGLTSSAPALSWNPAPESNKMQVVVRGSNGTSLYSGTFNSSGAFENWTSISGTSASAPALAWKQAVPNSMKLAVRHSDNTLWTASFSSGGAFDNNWASITGTTPDAPAILWHPVAGQLWILAQGMDNGIWKASFDSSGAFNNDWIPISPAGAVASAPAAAWNPVLQKVQVLIRKTDNSIWMTMY